MRSVIAVAVWLMGVVPTFATCNLDLVVGYTLVAKNTIVAFIQDDRGIRYSRRHLYTLESERKFPKRVALGENRVGWIESEIDDWIREKAACRAA
jgi:prophage regulatory protein